VPATLAGDIDEQLRREQTLAVVGEKGVHRPVRDQVTAPGRRVQLVTGRALLHLAISILGALHLEARTPHSTFTIGLFEPFLWRPEVNQPPLRYPSVTPSAQMQQGHPRCSTHTAGFLNPTGWMWSNRPVNTLAYEVHADPGRHRYDRQGTARLLPGGLGATAPLLTPATCWVAHRRRGWAGKPIQYG
jgi:hypothetical protein